MREFRIKTQTQSLKRDIYSKVQPMTMANQKKQYLYVNRAQILPHFTHHHPTAKKTYMVDTSWWRSLNDHAELGALKFVRAECWGRISLITAVCHARLPNQGFESLARKVLKQIPSAGSVFLPGHHTFSTELSFGWGVSRAYNLRSLGWQEGLERFL